MAKPTPQDVRDAFINTGIRPHKGLFNFNWSEDEQIFKTKECGCAVTALLSYKRCPPIGGHTEVLTMGFIVRACAFIYDCSVNDIQSIIYDFDCGGEYWKAVEDLTPRTYKDYWGRFMNV